MKGKVFKKACAGAVAPLVRTFRFVCIFLLLATFLAGCGEGKETGDYFEIITETDRLSDLAETEDTSDMLNYVLLGNQFHQGERVQLWGERKQEGGGIYLHKEDGSRELLMEKVHGYFLSGYKWWMDEEGRCYIIDYYGGREFFRPDMKNALWTDNEFGTREGVVFRHELEENESFLDICQLEDGRIIMLMSKGRNLKLVELDPDSGRLDELQAVSGVDSAEMMAAKEKGVFLLGRNGLWECSLEDGRVNSIISFNGSSYTWKYDDSSKQLIKDDFRLAEDGRVELLWRNGTVEYISNQEVNEDREILVLRIYQAYSWLKEQIVRFNQNNEKYYVVIEEPEDMERNRFLEQTDMEVGAGQGADIISSDAVNDAYSMLEKGALVDLSSYMAESGIREEDYFPAAFSGWRYDDKVYGINYTAKIEGLCIDKVIAGEEGISDIEDLVNNLLEYDGDAIFQKDANASWILKFFLKYSESLCGMVDFENGTCDFSGEVFEKMLEAARRYGDGAGKEDWKCLSEIRPYYTFYCFNDSEYLTEQGKTVTGYLFDDGGYTEMRDHMLAININSDKKEGAWEFISFLLGEEVQMDFSAAESQALGRGVEGGSFPVSRSAFEKLCGEHLDRINEGVDNTRTDSYYNLVTIITGLTEERKSELRTALEEARSAPLRTNPLIQIIAEEAEDYFSGTKNIDEVRTMVQNRVQLYLDER